LDDSAGPQIKKTGSIDFWLFFTTLILIIIGLLMVFSASAPTALAEKNDSFFYLKSQLKFAVAGFAPMFFFANFDYRRLRGNFSLIALGVSLLLLLAVLVPGIGLKEGGARRWISLGFAGFQPSELVKLALILFFADRLSRPNASVRVKQFTRGLMPYLGLIGFVAMLLLLEPHLSATVIVVVVCAILLFCGGARISHFVLMGSIGIAGLAAVMLKVDYMRDRVLSFMDPFKYASGEGYQAVQSLYAIGTGGLFGRGFGKSMQKFLYLPEPQNDYIFAILAEELGLVGVVVVVALFAVFIWRGLKIAFKAHDTFGSLLAIGITSLIGIQALFNIAVVTSSVPPTGVSLPFFSAGGTSLMILMAAVGVLLNISRHSDYDKT
jgi:cell division protein FtsW